jgi:hypothetical protein
MKNKLFLAGMLAMALAFGLIMTGCPTDTDDDDGGGGSLPATEAVGTWTKSIHTLTINADGTGTYSYYDVKVTAATLELSMGGTSMGTANYTVSGNTLTVTGGTSATDSLNGTWTKQP